MTAAVISLDERRRRGDRPRYNDATATLDLLTPGARPTCPPECNRCMTDDLDPASVVHRALVGRIEVYNGHRVKRIDVAVEMTDHTTRGRTVPVIVVDTSEAVDLCPETLATLLDYQQRALAIHAAWSQR